MRDIIPLDRSRILQHFNRELLAEQMQTATQGVMHFRYSHDEIGSGEPFMACCPTDDGMGIAVVFPDDCENVVEAFAEAMDDLSELYALLAGSLREMEGQQ